MPDFAISSATASYESVFMSKSNWIASFSLCLCERFFGSKTRRRNSILPSMSLWDTISTLRPTSSSKKAWFRSSFTFGRSSLRKRMQCSIMSRISGFSTLSKLAGLTPWKNIFYVNYEIFQLFYKIHLSKIFICC